MKIKIKPTLVSFVILLIGLFVGIIGFIYEWPIHWIQTAFVISGQAFFAFYSMISDNNSVLTTNSSPDSQKKDEIQSVKSDVSTNKWISQFMNISLNKQSKFNITIKENDGFVNVIISEKPKLN